MRFRLDQDSFIGDVLHTAGAEVEIPPLKPGRPERGKPGQPNYRPEIAPVWHKPGPHWFPLDDEARELMRDHEVQHTGEVPDALPALGERLAEALAKASVTIDHEKLGAAVGAAVAESLGPVLKTLAEAVAAKPAPVDVASIVAAVVAALDARDGKRGK